MKNSTFWNVLVWTVAAVLGVISAPFIVLLFVAKTLEVIGNFVLDKLAANPLSAFLISKREQARKEEATPSKTTVEELHE